MNEEYYLLPEGVSFKPCRICGGRVLIIRNGDRLSMNCGDCHRTAEIVLSSSVSYKQIEAVCAEAVETVPEYPQVQASDVADAKKEMSDLSDAKKDFAENADAIKKENGVFRGAIKKESSFPKMFPIEYADIEAATSGQVANWRKECEGVLPPLNSYGLPSYRSICSRYSTDTTCRGCGFYRQYELSLCGLYGQLFQS